MHAVVDWEVNSNSRQKARVTMATCLVDHLHILSSQLYHSDIRIASVCIGLINLVKIKGTIDLTMLHGLAHSVVDFAFILFGCQGKGFSIYYISLQKNTLRADDKPVMNVQYAYNQ